MPNSLKVRLGKLKYKGIISDKDYERLCKALEQQPCKDAISRELALREIDKYMCGVPFEKTLDVVIQELPPVTPKAKTDVLDKIRAEIDSLHNGCGLFNDGIDKALAIIDKYTAESEG